jgi:MoaA/NifB/PqqE/SkfB family radical SAM enzyme
MDVDFDNPYPPRPKELLFDITSACNQACYFCGNQKKDKKAYIDKKIVFRLMREAKEIGITDIALYLTGEPFLHKDLAEMVLFGKEIGIEYIFLSTNGSLATPERAKPVLDAGIDSIKFSINAGTRESYLRVHGKDHFDTVMANIKWFSKYRRESGLKYRIYVSMVKNSKAEGDERLLKDAVSPFIDEFDLRNCSNQGGNMYENNATETIQKNNLLGSLKEHQYFGRCPDIFSRMSVTVEGYATACVVDYKGYLIMGDLNKSTIKEVWGGEAYTRLRKMHISGNLKGIVCYNCLNNTNQECRTFIV